jgi:hypothetical protein
VTVVVRRPGPPLDGLVRAITYQAGEQPRTSVEKILPGPGASLWINLNRDEFRSYSETGQVVWVPGAMLAGPTSRAAVIEFEQGRAHISVTFALGAAGCFFAPPLDVTRDLQVSLEDIWGRSRRISGCCPGRSAVGSRRTSGSARSASPECSGCSGWSGTSTGVRRSTGRRWPRGTGTLTSRIWWRSSVSW